MTRARRTAKLMMLFAAFVGKKLCPELLLLGVDFDIISKYSKQVMNVCREYDPNMLVAGCDEGYMK